MADREEWVTVYITGDEVDAQLKKGLLETAGIECIIEASIYRPRSVTPLFNRIALNVRKENEREAGEIIRGIQ